MVDVFATPVGKNINGPFFVAYVQENISGVVTYYK